MDEKQEAPNRRRHQRAQKACESRQGGSSSRCGTEDQLDPANNLTTAQILEARSQAASNPVPTPNLTNGPVAPLPPAATITDLRAKLQAKLATFRRDRGVDEDEEDPKSRDALEDARRVRRGEMRDKRRKERKEARRKAVVTASTSAKTAKVSWAVRLPSTLAEPPDTTAGSPRPLLRPNRLQPRLPPTRPQPENPQTHLEPRPGPRAPH